MRLPKNVTCFHLYMGRLLVPVYGKKWSAKSDQSPYAMCIRSSTQRHARHTFCLISVGPTHLCIRVGPTSRFILQVSLGALPWHCYPPRSYTLPIAFNPLQGCKQCLFSFETTPHRSMLRKEIPAPLHMTKKIHAPRGTCAHPSLGESFLTMHASVHPLCSSRRIYASLEPFHGFFKRGKWILDWFGAIYLRFLSRQGFISLS